MGKSKSYRGGPAFQGRNTPGAETTPSRGSHSDGEGTKMSGTDGYGRMGMSKGTRAKSKSGKVSAKAKGIYGQS